MLIAEFHDHMTISSVGKDFLINYGRVGHLGHVTRTINVYFLSDFARRLHIRFGFDWPSGFREKHL